MAVSSDLLNSSTNLAWTLEGMTWGPSILWFVWMPPSLSNRLLPPPFTFTITFDVDSPVVPFCMQVMVDPDAPSPSNPNLREYLHWLAILSPFSSLFSLLVCLVYGVLSLSFSTDGGRLLCFSCVWENWGELQLKRGRENLFFLKKQERGCVKLSWWTGTKKKKNRQSLSKATVTLFHL